MTVFREILASKAAEAGLLLSDMQLEQFSIYYNMLIETNKVMNLTTLTEPEEVAMKHVIDSLLVYEDSFQSKSLADVGTGAGFPGIPLKIYCPSLKVTLIDSLAKRLGFLDRVIGELGLSAISTVHLRAEEAGHVPGHREHYDLVVARAVASLPVLAEYCLPLVKVGGCFYAMKGAKYMEEIVAASKALSFLGGSLQGARVVELPGLEDVRVIIKVKKDGSTPKKYPRKAGQPVKMPL